MIGIVRAAVAHTKKKKPTEFRIVILSAEATRQQWRIVFFFDVNAHTWRIVLVVKYVIGL